MMSRATGIQVDGRPTTSSHSKRGIFPDDVMAIRKYLDASKNAMGKPKCIAGINLGIIVSANRTVS